MKSNPEKQRISLEARLYRALSDTSYGGETMPLDHRSMTWTDRDGVERIFAFVNDASEIGVEMADRWQIILKREDVHRLARWYVRQWAFGEWFGLRRWAWYRLLHRRVERGGRR